MSVFNSRVYRWQLLIEEFSPQIEYIKGVDNTVADAISRLEYNPELNPTRDCFLNYKVGSSGLHQKRPENHNFFAICKLMTHLDYDENISSNTEQYNAVFANQQESSEIFPLTVTEISQEHYKDKSLSQFFKTSGNDNKSKSKKTDLQVRVISDVEVLVHDDTRMVIPKSLQKRAVAWYHHYLQHPGHTRLEETISATMYWKSMRTDIRSHVKKCSICQKSKVRRQKFGKLPTKLAITRPWEVLCVDLIGPYTVKVKGADGTVIDFMCLTMIDPASGWFEICELPASSYFLADGKVQLNRDSFDKSSAQISRLVNKSWLSRYPRPKAVIYDNGSEFKLHFVALCKEYGVTCKPTTIKNPTANSVLERIHGVFGNMLRTSSLDMAATVTPEDIDDLIINAAWAIRSTHHTVLNVTPGAAIFGRDMLFDIPYIVDWKAIGLRRQARVDKDALRHNVKRIDYDYAVGEKILIIKDGILRKAEDKYVGPFTVTQVYTNGTVRIQRGKVSERLNIRRIVPFHG